jgi:hypothetical protein
MCAQIINNLITHAIKVFEGVWGNFSQKVPPHKPFPHNRVPLPDKSKFGAWTLQIPARLLTGGAFYDKMDKIYDPKERKRSLDMKETAKKIRLIYGLVLSALLVCTGVCLIVACLSIYQSGDAPFTRESIGAWFSKIAIPVWATVAAIVGGGVLALVFPSDEPRLRGIRDGRAQLERLRARVDLAGCDGETREKMQKEQMLRQYIIYI